MSRLRVLLVSSWGTACGIAEHAKMLVDAVQIADSEIQHHAAVEALDPEWVFSERRIAQYDWQLVHLDHHDALHSRWQPYHVQELVAAEIPVLVTYHDSRERLADCPKLAALAQVASSVVVHEPVEGLQAIYWRQGVPEAAQDPVRYDYAPYMFKAFPQQPVLGTVGFNFPWKNFDRLAQVTGEEGWALVLLSNNATEADEQRWRALNSSILLIRKFVAGPEVVNYLAGCDLTAFMYECANTGTSGAIRQGIAARKPVIGLQTCRQFRDLYLHDASPPNGEGPSGIDWVGSWEEFHYLLRSTYPAAFQPRVSAFAHRESWTHLGRNYAELYRMLAGGSHDPALQ